MSKLKTAAANRSINLRNTTCPYCGVDFSGSVKPEKEHTIARNFVPKGTLFGQWNLLLCCCRVCNGAKSGLEDDISAISMHPDAFGQHVNEDARLHAEARRKGQRAINRKTRRPVGRGEPPTKIDTKFANASFSFSFTGPPQAVESRLFELAQYHIAAFFYWITYNDQTSRGSLLPGQFWPLVVVRKGDWGNPHLRWFAAETKNWPLRVHAVGAEGYFKCLIRRVSESEDLWSWALEWNQNFRLVGFFGCPDLLDKLEKTVPPLTLETIFAEPGKVLRYRAEIPLSEADDTLFSPPDECLPEVSV